jgi:hypothetical protein
MSAGCMVLSFPARRQYVAAIDLTPTSQPIPVSSISVVLRTPDPSSPVGGVTQAELLASADQQGADVSAHQLKRWRRAGLVPRPTVERVAGLRGSRALYPGWAIEQLAIVERLHRSIHRIDALRVAVWWEGHWVQPDALRSALIAPLERVSAQARELTDNAEDPFAAADAIVAAMAIENVSSKITSLLRKRLGSNADLINLIWTFLSLGFGAPGPWVEDDHTEDPAPDFLELLERATGTDLMRTKPTGAGGWIAPDFDLAKFTEELQNAGAFDVEDMSRPIRDATDVALQQARAYAAMFYDGLNAIGQVLQELRDEEIPWLSALSTLEPEDAADRSGLIRNMLILRALAGDETLAQVGALVEREHARFRAIGEIRAALPQYQSILRTDAREQLTKLGPAKAAKVRADIDRYLNQHPEVAKALSGGG